MKRPATTAAAAGAIRSSKRRRVSVGSTEHYEEVSRLGAGNYGAVVKGRHRVTGQTVAIKRLSTAASDSGEDPALEASLHEACGDHPFIVGFHGLARDPATSRLCLVTECVDGPGTLHDYLHRRRGCPPLPEHTVRSVMWQLLAAAEKMSASGVIHRDLKPENVLISGDHRTVKICDFGLAMSASDAPPYEQAGTLAYKAPEMMLEIPVYDARVDAWSLGCVMAEVIGNGTPPFQGGAEDEDGQLRAIFDALGVPDGETWPEFSSTPFATKVLPELDDVNRKNRLREVFPEAVLSQQGFEVLDGLLTCNPGKRLTASAALKHAWFAKVDALELPRKDEVASALPGKMARTAYAKRRKMQCV
ncbi:unnamed protein product [Urochloa decumbens]|uniref:[RNA-polymerase]-subunit kinase n=1 Tax=Urochloa decumbens TaxID=240449 RepID=A0ABC8YH35_9POAL